MVRLGINRVKDRREHGFGEVWSQSPGFKLLPYFAKAMFAAVD